MGRLAFAHFLQLAMIFLRIFCLIYLAQYLGAGSLSYSIHYPVTLYVLVSPAIKLFKQFGPRSSLSKRRTSSEHSGRIPERFFIKVNVENNQQKSKKQQQKQYAKRYWSISINRTFAFCKGGNFNVHTWAWFGYLTC